MTPRDLADARALLRLRVLREDAARGELQRRRADEAAAREVVDRRLRQIDTLRGARRALLAWQTGEGAADAPRVQPYAAARMAALDDELERAEVELIDERQALQRAGQALQAAQAAWVRASARRQAVDRLAADTRRALALQSERRAERELDGAVPNGVGR